MPSPIVAADLISSAARLAGVLADGETLTPSEYNDSLLVLNDLLENWSTERLSVWDTANEVFNLVATTASYTMGAGGAFNTTRPPLGILGGFVSLNGADFPLTPITEAEYDLLVVKSQQGLPERVLYVGAYPLATVTFWPVPSEVMAVSLQTTRTLAQATLTTSLSGPPGWVKALRSSLGVELCAEFGLPATDALLQIAADSKGDYKRSNQLSMLPVAGYDSGLLTGGPLNWQTGY
jgi:hypothetical protein